MSAQGWGDTPTTDPLRALELSIKESMITMNAAKHGQLTPVEMRKNETLQTMLNVVRAAIAQTEQNAGPVADSQPVDVPDAEKSSAAGPAPVEQPCPFCRQYHGIRPCHVATPYKQTDARGEAMSAQGNTTDPLRALERV
jgi:hypothetical protein